MAQKFINFICSEKSSWLRKHYPKAFLLLSLIAERARKENGYDDGLIIGDAILGNPSDAGLTRQEYRTAIQKLVQFKIIKIISNGKEFYGRDKSTIKATIHSYLVNLCNSDIWDIKNQYNQPVSNQRSTNTNTTINTSIRERYDKPDKVANQRSNHNQPTNQPKMNRPTNPNKPLNSYNSNGYEQPRNYSNQQTISKYPINQRSTNTNTPKIHYSNNCISDIYVEHQNLSNQRSNHKQLFSVLCKKETSKEKSPIVPFEADASIAALLPLSHEAKEEDIAALQGWFDFLRIIIDRPTIKRWLEKNSLDKVLETVDLFKQNVEKITNPGGWITKALQENYALKKKFTTMNREFAIQFIAENNLKTLKINKKYCVDTYTGNDYQFEIDPKNFQQMLIAKYK